MKAKLFYGLLLAACFSYLISYLLETLHLIPLTNTIWLYSIAFFLLINTIINVVFLVKPKNTTYINLIMSTSIIRLLASGLLFLIGITFFEFNKMVFFLHFMLHYLVFSVIEMVVLIKFVNNHPKNTL